MSDEMIDVESGQVREEETPQFILNDEQLEYVRAYLQKEIGDTQADAGREDRIARNTTIDRQRQIRPEHAEMNFPWDGAANTVPPLLWSKVSSVVSKFTQAILNKDPIFVYESSDDDYTDHAQAITRHVEDIINDPNQAGFRKKIWPLEFDKASFGTVFVKVPFEKEVRYFTRLDKETGAQTRVEQVIRSCPKPYIIPFEDFFTRFHWGDIQKAPWIAVRHYKFFHELKALEAEGKYQNVDLIWGRNQRYDDQKIARLENAGITEEYNTQDPNKIFEIFEVNMFFDVDGTGFLQDIIIHYELESNTILRIDYNDLGRRDIVRIPYVEFAQILYGMGIGDMTTNLQEMIETVFNTSFNSDELSYMGMLLTRSGSGIAFGENAFPGATIEVPDPNGDIARLDFPSATATSMMLEQKIMGYADQATGATSMLMGQENKGEGNRIGSTGTQFLAARGDAYLESFLELAVNGYAEIGELILMQLVRNVDNIDYSNVSESDKVLLEEVYSTPVEDIMSKFRFNISMANIQQETRERQQALIQLFELYGAFMDRITQYTTVLSNPELAQPAFERLQEVMMTSFVGMNKIMERILENFNEKEIADFLPFYKDMELVLERMDQQKEEMVEDARTDINRATAGFTEQFSTDIEAAGGSPVMEPGVQEGTPVGTGGLQGPGPEGFNTGA